MSFQRQLAATAGAVCEALDRIEPVEMARVAGYGRYGGRSDRYRPIEDAAMTVFDVFRAVNPSTDLSDAAAAPDLVRGRMLEESVLDARRRIFAKTLDRIANVVDRLDPTASATLEAAWLLAPRNLWRAFQDVARSWAPEADAARKRIYLASRYASALKRALAPTILAAGYAPVAAERMAGPNPLDMARGELRRRIGRCDGAIVSLVDDAGAFNPAAGAAGDVSLSAALVEAAEAERLFPERFLLILNSQAETELPADLRRKPAFDLAGAHLEGGVRAKLQSMLTAPRWSAGLA